MIGGYFCKSPVKRFTRWQWLMASNLVQIPDVSVFLFKDLHRATQRFAPRNWLGEGKHGIVYLGQLAVAHDQHFQPVAVKRFKPTTIDPMFRILRELGVHKALSKNVHKIHHPTRDRSTASSTNSSRLRQLLGVCFHVTGPLLVYEFVPNGTLRQHLRREKRGSLLKCSAMVRLSIAIDVAHSLCELHFRDDSPSILHRNVKSSKILLEDDYRAKLADLGDAAVVKTNSDRCSPMAVGTPGYRDPVYEKSGWACDKTDVYSFGVVLMELATHLPAWDPKRPTPKLADLVIGRMRGNREDGVHREDTYSVERIIQPGTVLGGMTLMKDVLYLAVQCCNLDANGVPRIDEVHAALLQIQQQSLEMLLLCNGDELTMDDATGSAGTGSLTQGRLNSASNPWKP